MTGDPAVLLAGETLRYTITVRNTGTSDAANVVLRDQIPVNTSYVAGSTTLNGAPVADASGTSPLVGGMLINAPSDPTPGAIPADVPPSPGNVATITFDVIVDPTVDRRHGDLEPGLRERGRRRYRRPAVRRSGDADAQ